MSSTNRRKPAAEPWAAVPSDGIADLYEIIDGELWVARSEIEVTSPDGRISMTMRFAPPDQYVIVGVHFHGTIEHPVDAARLRMGLTEQAALQAQRFRKRLDPAELGSYLRAASPEDVWPDGPQVDRYAAAKMVRRARKHTLTPEYLLGTVKPVIEECEREGLAYGPVLAERFHISPSTARQWRMRLRELEGQS
jgi:hypothetical protein